MTTLNKGLIVSDSDSDDNQQTNSNEMKTNYRWLICSMLFLSTFIIYYNRQILALNWKLYLQPEFGWEYSEYSSITSVFIIVYSIFQLISGKIVDKVGTKNGFIIAFSIWVFGAFLQTFIAIILCRLYAKEWHFNFKEIPKHLVYQNLSNDDQKKIKILSAILFGTVISIMGIGESGNFPVSIKAVGEYFPKKDRALATAIFNSGSNFGAAAASLGVAPMTSNFGWESSVVLIFFFGIIWIFAWISIYKNPSDNNRMNRPEFIYIRQDSEEFQSNVKIPLRKCLKYRQTWAFAIGKALTDGAWWFYLFWVPTYLNSVFGLSAAQISSRVFVIYFLTMASIVGGYLPKYLVEKENAEPYNVRMTAMLIFAFLPLPVIFVLFFGKLNQWVAVIVIGIACAGHQSWSANIFSVVGDMFPQGAMGTVTGIGGMAGGFCSLAIQKISSTLFEYAKRNEWDILHLKGEEAGYFIIFIVCGSSYLIAWCIMKLLVPKYSPVIPPLLAPQTIEDQTPFVNPLKE